MTPEIQTAIADQVAADGIDVVPVETVLAAATAAGLSPAEAEAVASDYAAAQLVGLRDALGAVALVAVLGLWFTRRLPTGDPAADGRSASSRSAGRSNGVMAERRQGDIASVRMVTV